MLKSYLALALAAAAGLAAPASAAELITNGGFETGDFTGWTQNVQPGSNGNLFVASNGANAPISGRSTQSNASGGSFVALTSQSGPGSYSLTQSFVISPGTSDVVISYDFFVNAYASLAVTENRRDFHVNPNENAEVNILTGSASPFSTAIGDIVATLYGPGIDAGSNPHPWVNYVSDLGALAPGAYQIRFAQTDNRGYFTMGVDNVSVATTGEAVPEPTSFAILGVSLLGLGLIRRRA